eukprot:TRINITY_DN6572_c0_g1_i1.p1 TRINITY_DN6572_c0_g1~~TRINITY_DN6572_c0_g1_i1.p1  ORF type:complete len:488 (+),score=47.64 TRINITY_DN6572_c0_g1_i1:110-1573(+)
MISSRGPVHHAIVVFCCLATSISLTICPDDSQCPAGDTCCPTDNGYGCCPSAAGVCCGDETCCPSDFQCYAGNNTCTAIDTSKHVYDPWHPRWNLCHGPIPLTFLPHVLDDQNFAYYSSHGDIAQINTTAIEAVAVVVHGAGRNADEYFCAMQEAAALQTFYPTERVLVLAPWFIEPQDNPAQDTVRWNGSDPNGVWRSGQESLPDTEGNTVSSYAVLDLIMKQLNDSKLYPNLRLVTIAGHSSGGQTVQRYALTSHLTKHLSTLSFSVRYVVANPSSYAYLDNRRWFQGQLMAPNASTQASCPEYNAWEWGLDGNYPPYLSASPDTASDWIAAYADKDIRYLVGQNDTCNADFEPGCVSHGLETTCMDMLEGWMRRQRAEQYFHYLQQFFGRPVHSLTAIPNSGHDHTLIFQHDLGLKAIFEPASMVRPSSKRTLLVLFGCMLAVGVACVIIYQLHTHRKQREAAPTHSYQELLKSIDSDSDDFDT